LGFLHIRDKGASSLQRLEQVETLGRLGCSRVLSHQSSWVARKLFPRIRNWRVASRVGLRLALQACWGTDLSDTGRMKRSLRVIAVQSAGRERREKKRFAANTRRLLQSYLTICRGHVSSDTVLYQQGFDCLFVAHMIHVRACG